MRLFVSDEAIDYIDLWTEQFQYLGDFSWIFLYTPPSWSAVNQSMKSLAEKTSFDLTKNSSKVLEQYEYVRNYCNTEKITEWKDKKTPTEERWVEIFKHFEARNVPFIEFSQIVEYSLCLPGTSAPVERIFSIAKKVWKLESANLHMSTLKSILYVKHNMDFTCIEFFEFLKTQPQLVRQIASQDKYSFKQPRSTVGTDGNISAMSIDLDSSADI